MDTHVKERLTGAIILVGVLVLLVPELLTGPKREAEPTPVNTDEAPLRSYTIDLSDDAGSSRASAPPAPNKPAPAANAPMGAVPAEAEGAESAELTEPGSSDAESGDAADVVAMPVDEASAAVSESKSGSVAKGPADARPSENASGQALGLAAPKVAEPKGANDAVGESQTPVKGAGATNAKTANVAKPAATGAANAERTTGSADDGVAKAGGPAKVSSPANSKAASPAGKETSAEKPAQAQSNSPKATAARADKDTESQPSAKPAAPKAVAGSGYSVQVGVFANRKNADRLASDLKDKGFSAAVIESKSGGKRLFKVRVGSEPDRAAAQALQAKLGAAGQKGSVVSAR